MFGIKINIPEKYKKMFDAKMLLILGMIGKMAWDTFSVGANVKYQQHFDQTLQNESAQTIIMNTADTVFERKMEDDKMWKKALSNEHLIEFAFETAETAKGEITKQILAQDSSKVDFISALGTSADIRDENVLPMLTKLLIAVENGDLVFREDIEKIIEKEVKRRMSVRTVHSPPF